MENFMSHYFLFIMTTILITITPGADTLLVTRNTLTKGKKVGLKTVAGVCAGIAIHEIFALIGLSAIIASSVLLFEIVKYTGAAFLIYMGISALFSKQKITNDDTNPAKETSNQSHFLKGLLSNVLNPKAMVFFMSLLPQFITPGENSLSQIVLLGVTPVFITLIWLFVYVNLINLLRDWFNKPSIASKFQRITGIMLISLGMKLALEKR